ncbi:MAG: MerR family transcriptional regulator [Bifidobacteriaceae bacterium]|nr:MerR family transcriptional regulator [Bifidobacteriaceae bacterium]
MDLTIGELARMVGLTPRTVRYYESIGLLPEPDRTWGNYRLYCEEDVIRLTRVKRLTAMGLSLEQVADVIGRPVDESSEEVLTELNRRLQSEIRVARERQKAIDRIRGTGATIDAEPEFAARLVKQEQAELTEFERDYSRVLVDAVTALGSDSDRARLEWLFAHGDALSTLPEFQALNSLDKDLAALPDDATEEEIEKLADAYITAHEAADQAFPPGIARTWSPRLADVLDALLDNRLSDAQVEVQRRVRTARRDGGARH